MYLDAISSLSFLILPLSIILLAFKWILLSKNAFPPGPKGIPLLGVLPFLGRKPFEKFAEWSKKYGPVIHVKVGLKDVVILNSAEAINEAFVKKGRVFNHRAPKSLLRLEMKGLGLLNNEGETWTIHRRFTTQCLKNLGFGKMAIEGHLLTEIYDLIKEMETMKGKSFNPRNQLTITVANIIWTSVAGSRFSRNDPRLLQLAAMNDDIIKSLGTVGALSFYPQLRFIFRKKYAIFKIALDNLKNYLHGEIGHHRELFNIQGCSNGNLVSEYLAAAEKEKSLKEKSTFTDEQICAVLLDLFVAGLETTVTVLCWSFLFFLKYPRVQTKLQEEIDEVIGGFRQPTTEDRTRMPYAEAFMAEVLRYSCVIPMVHHCTAERAWIMDYNMPAGTAVIGNLWSLNRDPELWKNPEEFDVDRFLDENGKFRKVETFTPFGTGKRACPGESLARMEIFLFLVSLLQRFTLKPTTQDLTVEPVLGLVLSPPQFEMQVEQRRKMSE